MRAIVVGLFALLGSILGGTDSVLAGMPVLISQLQTGDTLSATNEAVELYNNTQSDQDVSNWCIRYSSANSLTLATSPKYCFIPADSQTKIYLSANSYASVVTATYALPNAASPDGRFSGSGMAAAGGHIKITDSTSATIDTLGWGTALYAEGYIASLNPAPIAPTSTQVLVRKTGIPSALLDSENNKADFEIKTPNFRSGGVYEIRIAVDLCGNIADIQEFMPSDYGYDETGNCEKAEHDLCTNINLIQTAIPADMLDDGQGGCHVDVCQNLEGLQQDVPEGFIADIGSCRELENRIVLFSEILPNAKGSDLGKEFIELYNPNPEPISLYGYTLHLGKNLETTLTIDKNITVAGYSFTVLYDNELGFTLLNTTNQLQLIAPGGNIVSSTSYNEPEEDIAWAFLTGLWQYTNRPTPGIDNIASAYVQDIDDEPKVLGSSLVSCAVGKYRHPITNRCRNIESDTAMLVACDGDEYRNPETNRCRKNASLVSSLAPCSEGSERNLETNRCRKVTGTSTTLTPCQAGYSRNPETNRCRKDTASSEVAAEVVKTISDENGTFAQALMYTAGAGAIGYGLYEWRTEFLRFVRRLVRLASDR